MSNADELKVIAKRFRWAYEELVFDQKMIELNRLSGEGLNSLFCYLKLACCGIKGVWLATRHMIPEGLSMREGLRWLARHLPGEYDELAMVCKVKEAKALWASLQVMYAYLLSCYGTQSEVLKALRVLVDVQRRPLKSLTIR